MKQFYPSVLAFCILICTLSTRHLYALPPSTLTFGTSTLGLQRLMAINPILGIIGASIAVAKLSHNLYKMHTTSSDTPFTNQLSYEQKKNELEQLKQECINIKNNLEIIKSPCYPGSPSFTQRFLPQKVKTYNEDPCLKISSAQELQLSAIKKEELQKYRETELALLEQEIFDIQRTLELHLDELIEQVNSCLQNYNQAIVESRPMRETWNNNLSHMTDAIAWQLYKYSLIEEHILYFLTAKYGELKTVVEYYNNATLLDRIKQATNIIEAVEYQRSIIPAMDKWIDEETSRIIYNISVSEQYFTNRGISIAQFKNETKKTLDAQQKERSAKDLTNAEKRKSNIQDPTNPAKNAHGENDKVDQPFGKYIDAPYHHPNSKGQKSPAPKNGQKALDTSKKVDGDTDRRVGVSEGEIVILRKTASGEYHGHTSSWAELLAAGKSTQMIRNTLQENGLVNMRGKIL
jgi:hypothetical protein